MESASTYFTRRARQERGKAADADTPEARTAHLELAFRLVKAATAPGLWAWPRSLPEMGDALAGAFPLPASRRFEELLAAVDATDIKGRH